MTIILVISDILSLAHIKAHLSKIVDRVEHHHDRIILTRNGKPAAVLLSPYELEALEDTLDLLSDPKALRAIEEARKEISLGQVLDAEALRNKFSVH